MPRPPLPSDPVQAALVRTQMLADAANSAQFSRPFVVDGLRIEPTSIYVERGALWVWCSAVDLQADPPRVLLLDLPFGYVGADTLVPDDTGDIVEVIGGRTVRGRHDPAEVVRRMIAMSVSGFR